MTHPNGFLTLPADLLFYASPPHACSYLPGREAATLFADPQRAMTPALYSALSDYGFRRSGDYVYRPRCGSCHACLPCRIPANRFVPDRSQRRVWARNLDLTVQIMPPDTQGEYFELYRRYLSTRHTDGAMDSDDRDQYRRFLTSSWSETWFVLFRIEERVVAVAVVDLLSKGLSAVAPPDLIPDKNMKEKLVVIGNGMAGIRTVEDEQARHAPSSVSEPADQ